MVRIRNLSTAISLLLIAATGIAAETRIDDLRWLSGCWASEGQEQGSGEMWTSPAGGVLLGLSRTVKDGRTVAHEFMQIRETAPGRMSFIALPSGQSRTEFELIAVRDLEVVFENLSHDFPQRVIYRRAGSRLIARIEGEVNGALRSVDFAMRAVPCEASTEESDRLGKRF